MVGATSEDWIEDIKEARIMVCTECGDIIRKIPEGRMFDVVDCAWTCPHCGKVWYSSDNWFRAGNLLLCV